MSDGQLFYWNAFVNLSTDRTIGMAVGPIPYSSVRRYADEFKISGSDEFEFFLGIVQTMDSVYLSVVNASEKDSSMVPVSDVNEQHRLFARLKERAEHAKKK